jgi:hypothetical protein
MNYESAKALVWTAGIVIVLALAVISPSGTFALLILAAIFAAIPAAFATKKIRIIAIALLIAAIALAAIFYPSFKQDYSGYLQRARPT